MELVKYIFSVGNMMAFVGAGYSFVLTICLPISKKFDPEKSQAIVLSGIYFSFIGIFIMVAALLYAFLEY